MIERWRSVAGAFKPFEVSPSDPNLDTVRDRANFQALLMNLAFPAVPFAR